MGGEPSGVRSPRDGAGWSAPQAAGADLPDSIWSGQVSGANRNWGTVELTHLFERGEVDHHSHPPETSAVGSDSANACHNKVFSFECAQTRYGTLLASFTCARLVWVGDTGDEPVNLSLLRMAVTALLSSVAADASSADRVAGTPRRRWATATGPTATRGAVPRASLRGRGPNGFRTANPGSRDRPRWGGPIHPVAFLAPRQAPLQSCNSLLLALRPTAVSGGWRQGWPGAKSGASSPLKSSCGSQKD